MPATAYAPGPVFAHVCTFGAVQDGPAAALLTFGGTAADALPGHLRDALLGHARRGERVLVLTRCPAQMAWVKAQVALLTAPGGRA